MRKKFLRRSSSRYSKLGRKKKQKWKRPTGRDNKMREKKRGYPRVVSIGYGRKKELKGTIDGKQPVVVRNIKEIEKIGRNELVIIGNVGKKRKIEIAKKASEKKIEIYNLNVKRFLKKNKIEEKSKEGEKHEVK